MLKVLKNNFLKVVFLIFQVLPGDPVRMMMGQRSDVVSREAVMKEYGLDQPLSQLVGFRMYLHFHLHAVKINLHTKMRKRVTNMELIVK